MIPFSQFSDYPEVDNDPSANQRRPSASQSQSRSRSASANTSSNNQWLSIDAACKILGVDQSTLRRWSDSGKIPVFRTPGGHRRYNEEDLGAFIAGDHRPRRKMSRKLLTSMSLAGYESDYLDTASSRPWYQAYDDSTLVELRDLGRRLVDRTINYVSGRGDRDAVLREGRGIGQEYGQISAESGLSTVDALEAFLFFRRPVIQAVNRYIDEENIPSKHAARIINELTRYLDDVLIATISAHQDEVAG
jgi:excisionase family DNA binding protein